MAFNKLTDYGKKLEGMASGVFDGGFGDDAFGDDLPDELEVGEDPRNQPMPTGSGFELSFMHHKNPALHNKPYFFTTQLGSPFPSYHQNPLPNFPARWTSIRGVRPPCESLFAPRVRLAPQELLQRIDVIEQMTLAARIDGRDQPPVRTINLSHQTLGDPYQFHAAIAFLTINKTVEMLNLNDNELDDINELEPALQHVKQLHLSHNNFVSFDALPRMPKLEKLYLQNNFLSGFDGFTSSKFPKLKLINIDLNPVQHKEFVYDRLVGAVPTLQVVLGADHREVQGVFDMLKSMI